MHLNIASVRQELSGHVPISLILVNMATKPHYQYLIEPSTCPLVWRRCSVVLATFVFIEARIAAKYLSTNRSPLSFKIVLEIPYVVTQCSSYTITTRGAATFGTGTAFVSMLYRCVKTMTDRFLWAVLVTGPRMVIVINSSGLPLWELLKPALVSDRKSVCAI